MLANKTSKQYSCVTSKIENKFDFVTLQFESD